MKPAAHKASILLMSVIVIGILTLFLGLAMAEVNLSTGYQNLNTTETHHSYYSAEACMEESLLRYERDTSFAGTTIAVDSETSCTSVVSGSQITITVSNGAYAETFVGTFSTTVSGTITNIHLTSWKET